jgi:hypothetical protein
MNEPGLDGGKKKLLDSEIFKQFEQCVPIEDIYKNFNINQEILIKILQRNIKGNYDYPRILNGGDDAQKQFLLHLENRWDPLNPKKPFKNIPAYID